MVKFFFLVLSFLSFDILFCQSTIREKKPGEDGIINLFVKDQINGYGVSAEIKFLFHGDTKLLSTNQTGRLNLSSIPGEYKIIINAKNYKQLETHFHIISGEVLNIEVSLDKLQNNKPQDFPYNEGAILQGYIVDENSGRPLSGATVHFKSSDIKAQSDVNGFFSVKIANYSNLSQSEKGNIVRDNIVTSLIGYNSHTTNNLLILKGVTTLKISMKKGEGIVYENQIQGIFDKNFKGFESEGTNDVNGDESSGINRNQSCPTLPTSIRVGTGCPSPVNCSSPCTGTVQVMTLEAYVQSGLDNEWISSWNSESLKAGAVAYRTYGAYYVNNPVNINYDIRSDICNQAWGSATATSCINAAIATTGEVIVNSSNTIVKSEYSAENNDNNNPNSTCGDCFSGGNGWPCISDNVCCGQTFNGHGRGMCQWGSQRWAANQGQSYTWILDHYYNPGNFFRCSGTATPPSNDNCSGAISITSSSTCNYLSNQTVNDATASGKPKGSCDNYSGTPALADVWYSFQAQSSSHTVTVDPNGSSLDAVIIAYSSCASNTEIGCSDTPGGNGTLSTLSLTGLTVGNTYYIRVYDYGTQTTNGGFRICVTHTAANCPDNFETNDNCNTATNVFASPLGIGTSDYTLNATIGYAGDQDWYKVNLAACGTFTLTLSNLPLNYDMELYATGATCTSNIISGSYNSGTNNEQIVYVKSNAAAATVYVKVYPISPSTFTASSCYSLRFQWASSTVTPAVNISANPSGTICTAQSVTFTATPTNGGSTPAYQWKVNGSNVGTNSPTYTSSSLTNGQVVTCVMTSNASCTSTANATSNSITMSVSAPTTPSVSIALTSGSNPTCNGQSLTFTAAPTNGGNTPSYQWKVNGNNVGTNSPTYTTSSLTNGQTVTCVMTSSSSCVSPVSAISNGITITVTGSLTPTVSIALTSGSNPTCNGQSLTFTATPTNGGSTPSYQWKVNGNNVGTNNSTYTTSSLGNGEVVTCVMTSNLACASPATSTSNGITITITGTLTPLVSISISSGSNPTCTGQALTFTAAATNGGTTPSFQWKVDGINVGTNSSSYTTSSLTNGQIVTCVMTSNLSCASPATGTSNPITISVSGSVTPAIAISQSSCTGNSIGFSSGVTNGGTNPVYNWQIIAGQGTINGNGSLATLINAANGTQVQCILTSSLGCANPASVSSNIITINCIVTAVPSITGLEDFNIIPNPTDGLFVLSLKLSTLKDVSFRLFTLTGLQVHQSIIYRISGTQTIRVDGSKWSVGVYFLEMTIGKDRFTRKIELIRN